VRFLGAFLPDPREVPTEVVEYVAEQLGIEDASCLAAYAGRAMTPYEHTWRFCQKYGYRELGEADEKSLRDFLAARAWASTEGPRALFDHSVAWLRERKILLPRVSRLTRLVTAVRAEASERLWRAMADRADDALRQPQRPATSVSLSVCVPVSLPVSVPVLETGTETGTQEVMSPHVRGIFQRPRQGPGSRGQFLSFRLQFSP
jgi:hypothetical protein